MAIKTFAAYLADQHPGSDLVPDSLGLAENLVNEALSAGFAKTTAVATIMKTSQLRQTVLKDRTANTAQKSIADMLFWLASMVAVAIGSMSTDAGIGSGTKISASR